MKADEIKSNETILEIKQHESPPIKLNGCFSSGDIKAICEVMTQCYAHEDRLHKKLFQNDAPQGITAHPVGEEKKALTDLLKPKLKDLYPNQDIELDFAFHQNYFPYGIHTDSGYNPKEIIFKQGIIPLEVSPEDKKVYTIIFKQKVYHSFGYPWTGKENNESFLKKNRIYIEDLTDRETIKPQEQIKYWRKKSSSLEYLSIDLAFEWNTGDMAIWDRGHLHCSSDFVSTGVRSKLGLMWISRIKS